MFAALCRGTRLGALLLGEGAALVMLVAVGRRPALALPWHRLGEWLHTAPPGDVLVALLRGGALLGVVWVMATTLLYVCAAASHVPAATRALRWSTVPAVRRVVDAAFAASMLSVVVVAPSAAATTPVNPTSVTVVRDGRARAGDVAEVPSPPDPGSPADPSPSASLPASSVDAIVVAPGDNLWELAARTVAAATDRRRDAVDDDDVARYWVQVCEVNRPFLVSGDVDLVFPGEWIVLPPYR